MADENNQNNEKQQWQQLRQLLADKGLGDLPEPDEHAWSLNRELKHKIIDTIQQSPAKSIAFADYMQMALYEPGLGYYAAGLRKFGSDGDFVTAPELSPLFGACIARQIQQVFESLPVNKKNSEQREGKSILEFGPGSGALCVSILKTLNQLEALPDTYYMIEVSSSLRERQQQTIEAEIPELAARVQWLDQLPQKINGVVLANEVMDAMPVERFRKGAKGEIESINVCEQDGVLQDKHQSAGFELAASVQHLEQSIEQEFEQGYESEINLWLEPWIKSISEVLNHGVVLLIDYGYPRGEYYHVQRSSGTLMCHYRQRAHEWPLILAGLQDITAFVDFTAVAEAAVNYGLSIAGFTTQAMFLMSCGIESMLDLPESGEPDQRYMQQVQQVKMLTLPSEMGDRFKVMALSRDIDVPLLGFAFADFTHRL